MERHHVVEFWGDPATSDFYGEDDTHYVVLTEAEVNRLRGIEQKAIEQSEYIQTHGLTEFEVGNLRHENEHLRAQITKQEIELQANQAYIKAIAAHGAT